MFEKKRFYKNLAITFSLMIIILTLAPATVMSTEDQPKYGGTLIIASGGDPKTFNLATTISFYNTIVASPVFNKLVKLDFDFKPRPEIAKSWKISEDGKTYTFNLSRNAKWHDGKLFTAADVKFTFEEILSKYHPRIRIALKSLDSIETPDDYTVVFHMKYPFSPFMSLVGNEAFIMPKHLYENTDIKKNPRNFNPIGTGPFVFKEWVKGSHVTLIKNENYFEEGKPYLDKIVIKLVPNAAARMLAFQSGEIDYVPYYLLPSSEIERLKKIPGIKMTRNGHQSLAPIMMIAFNTRKPPFNDKRVRQAIGYAIDKNFIVEKADFGLGKVATGPVSSETQWAYNPNVIKYERNLEKANKLLDEAGYKKNTDGIRFKTSIIADRGLSLLRKTIDILREQLKGVGIDLELRPMDRNSMIEATYIKWDFDMQVHGLGTGPHPAISVARLYVSSNIRKGAFTNCSGYSNPKVDELFDKAARAQTQKKAAEYYFKVQEILTEDVPYMWLVEYSQMSAWRDEFKKFHTWSSRSWTNADEWYWDKGREKK